MGLSGWWSWLSEEVDKLKAVKAVTKDPEQVKALEEVIASLESKLKRHRNEGLHKDKVETIFA